MSSTQEAILAPIINDMLKTQGMLNRLTIGEEWWSNKNCNFHLAIQQEASEGIDHLGWKWWTPQKTNIRAAQIEAVDIMHFVLSAELAAYLELDSPDEKAFVANLVRDYETRKLPITLDALQFRPGQLGSRELFSLLSTMAGLGHTSFGMVCLLAEELELTFVEFSKLYRAKATLNTFRQCNGYAQGTYRKMWREGEEDNDVMQKELLSGIDWLKPEASHQLYHKLEEAYTKFLGSK